jgi:hypothetical protein
VLRARKQQQYSEIERFNNLNISSSCIEYPIDISHLNYERSLLLGRQLNFCTYIGHVQFQGEPQIQLRKFLDILHAGAIYMHNIMNMVCFYGCCFVAYCCWLLIVFFVCLFRWY